MNMKFAFQSIVTAAAFVAAGAASATTIVLDGTYTGPFSFGDGRGALEFSELMMGALVTGNTYVSGFGGATVGSEIRPALFDPDEPYEPYDYEAKIINVDLTHLSFDPVTGKYTNVLSVGGVSQTMAANTGIMAAGGTAQVGNLDVRFLSSGDVEIYGTITGQSLGASTAVNYSGLVYTASAADVSGMTSLSAAAGVYNTTIQNLAATDTAFNALAQSFGFNASGLGYSAFQQATANVGTLTLSIINTSLTPWPAPTPSIPEPSTYALMGLGLVGLALARRRAAK